MYIVNKRKLRKTRYADWWDMDLVIKGPNCVTFALVLLVRLVLRTQLKSPGQVCWGEGLQLGQLRPFGHTGVCGTRWDGSKDAVDKSFLSHLRSQ